MPDKINNTSDDKVDTDRQKKNHDLKSYIDRIESGVAYGWAADMNSSTPLEIMIFANDVLIGEGQASIYRADLAKNNIHQGKHAFAIDIHETSNNTPQNIEVRLRNSDEKINAGEFILEPPQQSFSAQILHLDGCNLIGSIQSSKPINNTTLDLYRGDEHVSTTSINSEYQETSFIFAVSPDHLNGRVSPLKIIAREHPFIIGHSVFSFPRFSTPWKYINESYLEPGFLSLPVQADHRYESLTYQLKNLSENKSALSLSDIQTTHSAIAQSYEGRTKFPPFALPFFDEPEVSIIVPAFNKFELTYHCIASIALSYNKTSYEVILADDCSDDLTSEAEFIIENLVISRSKENLRFLKNCNQASSLAKGEFLIFLNNDTETTSFWIDELVNAHKSDDRIGMTGSKLLNSNGTLQEAGGIVWSDGQPWNVGRDKNPADPEYNYSRQVDYLTGAAMCLPASIWDEVGKFSSEFEPCYYEDTDLAFKVRAAGYKTVYVPHSEVVHFEGQSHGRDIKKGLKSYQTVNESTFKKKWFKAFKNNGTASMANLSLNKDRNTCQRILVIDYSTPCESKDAGSYAVIQELKMLTKLGFKVTFLPENLVHLGKYTKRLQRMGVETLYAPLYTSVFDALNKRLSEFDAVYMIRYSVAELYIDHIKSQSNAKIIFNNCDLHFLRELRSAFDGDETNNEIINKAIITRGKELDVCLKADAVLCYNTTEHAVITSHILSANKLHLAPWVLYDKDSGPQFKERSDIAFLGGYNHPPNVDAVNFLAKEVMPALRKIRPEIILNIYGSSMPKEFKNYQCANINIVGFVDSLDDVYHKNKIFLAPLFSGAGIKGKVLDSMAYGLPAIVTDVAAEGTGLSQGISALFAESVDEWVSSIVNLYDNEELWNRLSDNQRITAKEKFSFVSGVEATRKIYDSVGLYSDQ